MEFDAKCAPSKDLLVWYFYKDLRPSIKLWIDEEGRELDGWEELIRKATRAEANAEMQTPASRDMDQRCYHRSRPVHASLDKASSSRDSRIEESKPKAQEPKASNSNNSSRPDQGGNTEEVG